MAKQTEDFNELRVAELRERAKDAGVQGTSHMRKDELVDALADESGATDILTLLKSDHQNVNDLFEQALSKDDGDAAMAELAAQIVGELEAHTEAEEKIFYPALKTKAEDDEADDAKDGVVEAYVEHGSVKELIAKLRALDPADESYRAVLTVMREQIEHHVEEEESEMFRNARRLFSRDELASIGAHVAEFKASGKAAAV